MKVQHYRRKISFILWHKIRDIDIESKSSVYVKNLKLTAELIQCITFKPVSGKKIKLNQYGRVQKIRQENQRTSRVRKRHNLVGISPSLLAANTIHHEC
jgi:hypothetical protein